MFLDYREQMAEVPGSPLKLTNHWEVKHINDNYPVWDEIISNNAGFK